LSQDDRFATYWARYDNRAEFTVIVEEALARQDDGRVAGVD